MFKKFFLNSWSVSLFALILLITISIIATGISVSAQNHEPPIEQWQYNLENFNAHSIAVDAENNIYIGTTDNAVKKFDSNGNLIWIFEGHSGPVQAVALDNQGNIYS